MSARTREQGSPEDVLKDTFSGADPVWHGTLDLLSTCLSLKNYQKTERLILIERTFDLSLNSAIRFRG